MRYSGRGDQKEFLVWLTEEELKKLASILKERKLD